MEEEEHHLPERQRHHQEEEALGAQRQRADQQGGEARGRDGGRQGDQDRETAAGGRDEIDGVGGEPVERRVAEADQARAADQQLQAQRQHGGDHRVGAELDVVGGRQGAAPSRAAARPAPALCARTGARQHQRVLRASVMCVAGRTGRTAATAARRPSAHTRQGRPPSARRPCRAYRPARSPAPTRRRPTRSRARRSPPPRTR